MNNVKRVDPCLCLHGVVVISLSSALTRELCGELIKTLLEPVLRKRGELGGIRILRVNK